MHKFKVGDKVRILIDNASSAPVKKDDTGTVEYISNFTDKIAVRLDSGDCWSLNLTDIMLVDNNLNCKGSKEIVRNRKCTCGIESVGGGIHSTWCDINEKTEKVIDKKEPHGDETLDLGDPTWHFSPVWIAGDDDDD